MKFIKIFLFILPVFIGATATAQRPTPARPKPVVAFKPPKLIASIGNFKDTMNISLQDADAVIGMPLKITDAKGGIYTVSSYQFLYRQIVVTETEDGRPALTTSVKSSLFKSSPLPPIWVNTLREKLRPNEEFLFFDVIARDAQGRVMYAPNIKLTLK